MWAFGLHLIELMAFRAILVRLRHMMTLTLQLLATAIRQRRHADDTLQQRFEQDRHGNWHELLGGPWLGCAP